MKKRNLFFIAILTPCIFLASCGCAKEEGAAAFEEEALTEEERALVEEQEKMVLEDAESEYPEEDRLLAYYDGSLNLDELSIDELYELYDEIYANADKGLGSDADYEMYFYDADLSDADADTELSYGSAAGVETAVITDDPWEDGKDFAALDIMEDMSPTEKAEYEAFMEAIAEMADEMGEMGEEALDEDWDAEGLGDPHDDDGDSGDAALLEGWPDNEFTRQVPEPSFKDPMIVSDSSSLTIMASNSSADEAKAYVAKLKNAGFNQEVDEQDQNISGMSIYTFYASNGKGYSVEVTFVSGQTAVVINKD